jgi:molybdopterin adenylyltransferase
VRNLGLKDDAHSGSWHRQLSLLANESVDKIREKGLTLKSGDFAENITTEGLELHTLPVGARLKAADGVLLEITQIGKQCHHHCEIYKQVGDCVMPREGVFVRIHRGGKIKEGDDIHREDYITAGIIIASDKGSRGEREDGCGAVITEALKTIGGEVLDYTIQSDDKDGLIATLNDWCENNYLDLILISGGTGFSPRDNTPEAIKAVIEKEVPGIPEAMRAASLAITPHAMLSRSVAGIKGKTLIIALPGSPKAVKENLEAVLAALPHGISIMRGVAKECAANQKNK